MAYNSVTKAPTLISLYLRNSSSSDYCLFFFPALKQNLYGHSCDTMINNTGRGFLTMGTTWKSSETRTQLNLTACY
jgi:hypothetical protein